MQIDANWDFFYFSFGEDHARADLIWNYKTREELKEAIENELRAFDADKVCSNTCCKSRPLLFATAIISNCCCLQDLRGGFVISWNHTEFEVCYETLAEEVKIGDHFLRLLLEDDPKSTRIHNAPEFFNDLYHRFLLTTKPAMKSMCLQAMAVVYQQCADEIGHFNDTEFIVHMLTRVSLGHTSTVACPLLLVHCCLHSLSACSCFGFLHVRAYVMMACRSARTNWSETVFSNS